MDSTVASLSAAGLILAISLVAAYMPFRFTGNPKLQTRVLTLSAGIMIGVLFVMMIPEALDRIEAEGHNHVFCSEVMMAGFLFVLLIGYLLHLVSIKSSSEDIGSRGLWIGFCVDAVIDGAVVATGLNVGGGTEVAILIAMCLHKGVEVFALANQVISGSNTASAKRMMVIYCFICPFHSSCSDSCSPRCWSGCLALPCASPQEYSCMRRWPRWYQEHLKGRTGIAYPRS